MFDVSLFKVTVQVDSDESLRVAYQVWAPNEAMAEEEVAQQLVDQLVGYTDEEVERFFDKIEITAERL